MLNKITISAAVLLALSCGEEVNLKKDKSSLLIDKKISELKKEKESLEGDQVASSEKQLEINYNLELKTLVQRTENLSELDEYKKQLASKYEVLHRIFEDEVMEMEREEPFFGRGFSYKNQYYKGPDFASVYHPLVIEQIQRVTDEYGPLFISEKRDASGRLVPQKVSSEITPWAGHWYPLQKNDLFDGVAAPLVKFDALMKKRGRTSDAAGEEKRAKQGFNPDGWEGMCGAWAMASVTNPEPKQSKIIDGIEFSVGDQKALLTYSHLKYTNERYGIPYQGNAHTDGCYDDIKPEAFHRIVLSVIGSEGRAIVIDDMAGVQVWNKPLYKYRWKIQQDPQKDYLFLVEGTPTLLKERAKETNEPTSVKDMLVPTYEYRLYVDKSNRNASGEYRVIASQWIERSWEDHPDTVTVTKPLGQGTLGSNTKEFDRNIDLFKKLFIQI
jgi:hypothetical protein